MPLETEARAELRALLEGLRPDDGDLLEALHRIHHRYGYISREAMEVVAEQLRLSGITPPAQSAGPEPPTEADRTKEE